RGHAFIVFSQSIEERTRGAAECLNLFGAYSAPRCTPERFSDVGDVLRQRVRRLHRQMGAPAGASAQEACSELLGRPCLRCDTSSDLPLRPHAPRIVSWPTLGNEPGWLADRLGPGDRRSLPDLSHALPLPSPSVDAVVEEGGGHSLYIDPALERNRTMHAEFAGSGVSRGVFVAGKTRIEGVGVFFAAEKDGRIRAPEGASLYFAGVDVQSAFCQHKVPAHQRPVSCLPAAAAGELGGVGRLGGRRAAPRTRLRPQLAVAPMGWSWALCVAQHAHERALGGCRALRPELRAVDFAPPPSPLDQPTHPLRVDNALVVGSDREEVTRVRRLASEALEAAGLAVHDETDASESMATLGEQGDQPDIERALGHCTFAALCRRESLSCFSAASAFVQQGYQRARPLWASARKELRIFRGVPIILRAQLDAPWSSQVVVTDACETGRASMVADWMT
ncbi:unnamed protein product, partial [Prorocentrum cordatum]